MTAYKIFTIIHLLINIDGHDTMDTKNSNQTLINTYTSQDPKSATPATFENLPPGSIFNQRWQILGELGRGGFGVVYHALDLNIDGREVAIKILTVDTFKYPEALTRFKKEVSITSKLRSPNTLMVYDFGVIDRYAYMISELLVGETLEQRLRKNPIHPDEALEIIKAVAQALAEAHQAHIVHRDIKPDNIYLNQTKGGYEVKLIDFGIAKVTEASGKATATQSFFGTPLYMSPEQIKDSSKVDHKTDIYSLGLVLYTCLVGRPPFEDEDFYQLLKRQVEEKLPIISFSQPKYALINDLIERMTVKNIFQRIQSMIDVVDQISFLQQQLGKATTDEQAIKISINTQADITLDEASHLSGFTIDEALEKKNSSAILKYSILALLLFASAFAFIQYQKDQSKQNISETQAPIIEKKVLVAQQNQQKDKEFSKELDKKIEEANKKLLEESQKLIEKNTLEKVMIEKNNIDKTNKIKSSPIAVKENEIEPKNNDKINTASKNKALIYDLIEKKGLLIKKCISVYHSDFTDEFLNLSLLFKNGIVDKISHASINTTACLNKIITNINFPKDIDGQVNIKILLPE
jgi:serine/threonine protein kinase